MPSRRKDLGFNMINAEAAIAAFVNRIIGTGAIADTVRNRLFSAGLKPDFIYSLKNGRQREFGAAKLVAALASCEDLEVVIEGKAQEGSEPLRWIVRARLEPPSQQRSDSVVRSSVETMTESSTGHPSGPLPSGAIQLSLFGSLQFVESDEIEMRDLHVTRKEPHRADIRVDFALRPRQTG